MSPQWGVSSEVGPLECVLVHQPGNEHRQTLPWNKDALLFDDILDVEEARPEHRRFARTMSSNGVEVLFLTDLLKDVFARSQRPMEIVAEIVGEKLAAEMDPGDFHPEYLIQGTPQDRSTDGGARLDPLPNMYFMRDPAFSVPGAIVISSFAKKARQREANLLRAILARHPRFQGAVVYGGILQDPDAQIEGGDVLIADEQTVIVGVGERSNRAGAEALAAFLFEKTTVNRLLMLFLPAKREFMHLDTVMTFVDRKRVLTMPYLWDQPEIYARIARSAREQCEQMGYEYTGPDPETLIEASRLEVLEPAGVTAEYDDAMEGLADQGVIDPSLTVYVAGSLESFQSPEAHVRDALREQWNDGANTFALKPGQVLGYRRNDRSIRALEAAGIEVLSFAGGELVRGRGGARCMTMPLRRRPI